MTTRQNKTNTNYLIILITCLLALLMPGSIACSSGGSRADEVRNPILPTTNDDSIHLPTDVAIHSDAESEDRTVLGVLDVVFNPETLEFEIEPERDGQFGYDPLYFSDWNVITLDSIDWGTGVVTFSLEITNPFEFNVYDVRGIIVRTTDPATELLNPDDYTAMHHTWGGGIFNINGFRSFAKFAPNRVIYAHDHRSETFIIQGPPYQFKLIVDVYIPGNTEQVYEISGQWVTNNITPTQGAMVYLNAFDHQSNIQSISIDTTAINGINTACYTNGGNQYFSDTIWNTQNAAPGTYSCLITAYSELVGDALYDYVDITVDPEPWTDEAYPITQDACTLDIGVIADPGGALDSQILMSGTSNGFPGSSIVSYFPDYAGNYSYVGSLLGLDPSNPDYQPWGVQRLDAANTGAFSFSNGNTFLYNTLFGGDYYNYQVWSLFDATRTIYTNPSPDTSRYMNMILMNPSIHSQPADVCDDFDDLQYSLFSTGGNVSFKDLVLTGTRPDTYTQDRVQYMANLDAFVGTGDGFVDPENIAGIDVYTFEREQQFHALVFILETSMGHPQIEVYQIDDIAQNWGWDAVSHEATITIENDVIDTGHDLELLPENPDYDLNPTDPTLCVLVSGTQSNTPFGEVYLFNALTGDYLETLNGYDPWSFADADVKYLDTDDDDFEIHVTWVDNNGSWATIFEHI